MFKDFCIFTLLIFLLAPNVAVSSERPMIGFTKKMTVEKMFNHRFIAVINTKDKHLNETSCKALTDKSEELLGVNLVKCIYGPQHKPSLKDLAKKHSYLFKIDRDPNKSDVTIEVKNLDGDEIDFKTLSWTLSTVSFSDYHEAVAKIFKKISDYRKYANDFKSVLLYRGITTESKLVPQEDGSFKDSKSGTTVHGKSALMYFASENEKNKNYLRAGLEIAAFLGMAKALYIAGHESMKEDWDFDNETFDDYKNRLFTTDQMKFDDNSIMLNWGHAYAGVLYFQAARNNGFNSRESLLVNLASSSIWEYFGENKEVVSINDQIITTIGGSVIGEVGYQISNMLKTRDSMAAKFISVILNPIGVFNNWIDGKSFSTGHRNFTSEYGFSNSGYDAFDIVMGLQVLNNKKKDTAKKLLELGFDAEVINLPVSNVGKVQSVIYDPLLAKISMNMHLSEDGFEDFHVITKLALSGYFNKNIRYDENGKKRGHSFFIGASSGTDYRSRGESHEDDFFAIVNIIGASLDVTYYVNGSKLRFAIDVYADFAMVRPYAVTDYNAKNGNFKRALSSLRKRGYYFASGHSHSASLSYENKKWRAGISSVTHYLESINDRNMDRHREWSTQKLDIEDEYRSVKVWVSYNSSKTTSIVLGLEKIFREGGIVDETNMIDAHNKDEEERIYIKFKKAL